MDLKFLAHLAKGPPFKLVLRENMNTVGPIVSKRGPHEICTDIPFMELGHDSGAIDATGG